MAKDYKCMTIDDVNESVFPDQEHKIFKLIEQLELEIAELTFMYAKKVKYLKSCVDNENK